MLLLSLHRVVRTNQPAEVEYSAPVSGALRWFHTRLVPQMDAGGDVVGVSRRPGTSQT